MVDNGMVDPKKQHAMKGLERENCRPIYSNYEHVQCHNIVVPSRAVGSSRYKIHKTAPFALDYIQTSKNASEGEITILCLTE